jgi:hypothetical protein
VDDPSRTFVGDLRGKARYADLTERLGEPTNPTETDLLIMLSRFLANGEVSTLSAIVDRAIDAARGPDLDLLASVAVLVADANPVRDNGGRLAGYQMTLTTDLARKLMDAVTR